MEPWEALDVDDSDLPSLLRPCKRLHRHQNPLSSTATATSTSLSQPLLTPCSHSSQTLIHDKEVEEEEGKNSHRDSQNKSERHRIVPGPAGAVQAAMLQKARDRENRDFSCSQALNPIPTQEYIRRAVQNASEFDYDFSSNPWISALQYIGAEDGVVRAVPLSSIEKCTNMGRVDQVVAVIKSSTQNTLGGLMVTLKDPTATIGASVHPKVLSESQFAKDFSVGSVLILQKVAIFSPSKSVHYLNITLRNLVKVFSKDGNPPSEYHGPAVSIKYAAPGEECLRKAGSLEKVLTPENGTSEEITDEMRKHTNREASSRCEKEIFNPQNFKPSRSNLTENVAVDKEPSIVNQDAYRGLSEATVTKRACYYNRGLSEDNDKQQKVSNPLDGPVTGDAVDNLVMDQISQEIQEVNILQKQRQPLISTASLPQWTDEQLEELFAGDDDSLF